MGVEPPCCKLNYGQLFFRGQLAAAESSFELLGNEAVPMKRDYPVL